MSEDLEFLLSKPEIQALLKKHPTTQSVISIYDIAADSFGQGEISLAAIGELTNVLHLAFNVLDYIDRLPYGYLAHDDLQGYVVRNGITEIGPAAFHGCKELVKVTIPSTVEYIGTSAFGDCPNLRFINLKSNNITWNPHTVFERTKYIDKIYFDGSKADWERLWEDEPQPANTIICWDGEIKRVNLKRI